MSQLSTFVSCPHIQLGLEEAWGYNNLGHDGVPGVQFVLSDANRMDMIQQQISQKPGGIRTVRVVYGQRLLESVVDATGTISCDGGDGDGETYKDYDISFSDGASVSWTVDQSDLITRCENDATYVNREVMKHMNVLLEKIDTDFYTALNANLGNFAYDVDSGSPAGTNTFYSGTGFSSGALRHDALNMVTFHMNVANGFQKVPFGFGGKPWHDYARAINAACCSALGIDVGVYQSANGGFAFAYSHKVTNITGNSTDAIFVAPGSVQMVGINQFMPNPGSIISINTPQLVQGVLAYPDPRIPITFDYRAELVCDNDVYKWKFSLAKPYVFNFLPDDMYQVGDRKEGINGVNKFRITTS